MVGVRLLVMQTVQQRRERDNRQINERLKTLIAAYKALGGSFTGDLAVDPTHVRDLRLQVEREPSIGVETDGQWPAAFTDAVPAAAESPGAERRRRVRDAVEAALSDVILLGTEEQVRLAAKAAADLAAGRPVETAEIVVSLRTFIRKVLELEPVPAAVTIPKQGPVRPAATSSRAGGKGESTKEKSRGGLGGGGAGMGGAGMGGGPDSDDAQDR